MTIGQQNWSVVQRLAAQYRQERDAKKPHQPHHHETNGKPLAAMRLDVSRRLTAYMAKKEPGVQGEHGSNPTYKAACHLVHGFALSPAEAYPYMVEYSSRCIPPWSDNEIWHKLRQAEKNPDFKGRPRGYLLDMPRPTIPMEELPPPPAPPTPLPFPVEALPEDVQAYVAELSIALQAPMDFAGVCCLAAASVALGAAQGVKLKQSWEVLGNLYIGIVAPPGSKKTPVQKQVMRPLRKIAKRLSDDFRADKERHDLSMEEWEDKKRKASRKGGAVPAKPEKPFRKRLVTDKTTVESLARTMEKNPRGMGLIKDELTGLMMSMNQYKPGGKGDDLQFFLSCWSNAPFVVDRVSLGDDPLEMLRPFLTICGGIPPEKLDGLMDEKSSDDGFVDRFLFCYPNETKMQEWSETDINPTVQAGWQAVVEKLYGLGMRAGSEGDEPHFLTLDREAKEYWIGWYNSHVAEINDADLSPTLRGPWLKMVDYAARLSVIIHWLRWACGEEVNADHLDAWDMATGCELANYFKSHARRVHLKLKQPQADQKADRVYQWILSKGGSVQMRQLMQSHVGGVRTREDADKMFERMQSLGMGTIRREPTANGYIKTWFDAVPPAPSVAKTPCVA